MTGENYIKRSFTICTTDYIIRVNQLRRMRWVGYVVRREEGDLWWGILRERDHLEDVGVDGTIYNKELENLDKRMWIGLIWLSIGTGGRLS